MAKRVICISREFGSGGHEIGVRTAAKLGVKLYEKELLLLACRYGEVAKQTLESSDEKATNPYFFQAVFEGNHHVTRGLSTSEVLFNLQSHEIKRLAKHEDCIFMGRCADYVLEKEEVHVLKVFVKAPLAYRLERKMQQEVLSERKALKLIRKMDTQRKKYYESFTNQIWGDSKNYDLIIDSAQTDMDTAVSQIVEAYRML